MTIRTQASQTKPMKFAGFGLVAGVDAPVAHEPDDEPLDVPPSAVAA